MKKIRITALLVSLMGLGFSMPASAANIGNYPFLKNTPAESFGDEDWKIFRETLNSALSESADGTTKTWENPSTKVSGEITLVTTVKNSDTHCRHVKTTSLAKDQRGSAGAIFCKEPDGSWKLFNVHPKATK